MHGSVFHFRNKRCPSHRGLAVNFAQQSSWPGKGRNFYVSKVMARNHRTRRDKGFNHRPVLRTLPTKLAETTQRKLYQRLLALKNHAWKICPISQVGSGSISVTVNLVFKRLNTV